MAQERPGWSPVNFRDDLNGDERWPHGCWKDLRESETAVLLDSLTHSANICWMTTVLLALYSAWSYSRKQKIFPYGAYILARDTDKSSNAPHYCLNYSFCKCYAGGCGSSPSFSSPSAHNLTQPEHRVGFINEAESMGKILVVSRCEFTNWQLG